MHSSLQIVLKCVDCCVRYEEVLFRINNIRIYQMLRPCLWNVRLNLEKLSLIHALEYGRSIKCSAKLHEYHSIFISFSFLPKLALDSPLRIKYVNTCAISRLNHDGGQRLRILSGTIKPMYSCTTAIILLVNLWNGQ